MIILLGFLMGLGLGAALTLLFEMVAKPIHSKAAIMRLTGQTPLGSVPLTHHGLVAANEPTWRDRATNWFSRRVRL